MSRMGKAEAQALLEGYAAASLNAALRERQEAGKDTDERVMARLLRRAGDEAAARLNRAARRALGERGDGRHHYLAADRPTIKTRNAR